MQASAPSVASVPAKARLLLFGLAFLSTAYFVQGAGANQNTRFDLVRAMVEDHSFRIDRFADNTFDKAHHDGHFYSDKAPGLAFVAALPYAGLRALGVGDPAEIEPDPITLHLLTLATVSLCSALAGVAMLGLLESLGASLVAGVVTVIAWLLGTNAFFYAGTFVSHQFGAALLVLGLAVFERSRTREGRVAAGLGAAAGGLLGWAMISEFTIAPSVGFLFLYGAYRQGWRRVLPVAVAGCVPLLLLGFYQWQCFGSPFRLGYGHLASAHYRELQGQGFFGISWPSPTVAGELLWGRYRGFLPLSPFLVLAVPGFALMLRKRAFRPLALVCLGSAVGAGLIASGYRVWHGGAALGPRHLVHALPFVIIPVGVAIAEGVRSRHRLGVAIGVVLLVLASIGAVTVSVAVMPELPEPPGMPAPIDEVAPFDGSHPFEDFALPCFLHGALSLKATAGGHIAFSSWVDHHDGDAFNLGEAFGLSGLASLLPLVVWWLAAGGALVWLLGRRRDQPVSVDLRRGGQEVQAGESHPRR